MLIPQSRRLEQLRRTADSIIDLADDVDPERDHIRGDPDGAVTLVEYADFECPYCGRAEPTIRELLDMHHKRRPALRLPPPAAAGRPPARAAGGGGERGGGGAGRLLADARHADGAPGRTRPRRRPPLRRGARTRRRPARRRGAAAGLRRAGSAEDVSERRHLRRLGDADLLHQRPPPPGRLRHRRPDRGDPPREGRRPSPKRKRAEAKKQAKEAANGASAREPGV